MQCWTHWLFDDVADIEAEVRNIQARRAGLKEQGGQGADGENGVDRVGLGAEGHYDTDIYGGSSSKFAGYVTSIAATEEQEVSTTGQTKSWSWMEGNLFWGLGAGSCILYSSPE